VDHKPYISVSVVRIRAILPDIYYLRLLSRVRIERENGNSRRSDASESRLRRSCRPASVFDSWKSKIALLSLAAIVVLNLLPIRRSFSAAGASRSSEAKAQPVMCSGSFQYSQTFSMGALIVFYTVIVFICFPRFPLTFAMPLATFCRTFLLPLHQHLYLPELRLPRLFL
jgi:hypothetical protein